MREILFRGKRIDNGEWVEGYYFERKNIQGNIIESVVIVDAYEQISGGQRYVRSNLNNECFRVDPETVGQFIGLTDKNSKRIFEGDILDVNGYAYACRWDDGNVEFGIYNKYESLGIAYIGAFNSEVIGNIHDNPELLKEDYYE